MRFVNVAVTDVAALLQLNVFDSRRAALERIRRRGGVRWRPGKSFAWKVRRVCCFALSSRFKTFCGKTPELPEEVYGWKEG